MSHKPLMGSPAPNFQSKLTEIIDIQGPASYSSPQTINASDLGWGGIEFAIPMNGKYVIVSADQLGVQPSSLSGTYYVAVSVATTTEAGKTVKAIYLKWYVVATGVAVAGQTNLSAEYVRLMIIGV